MSVSDSIREGDTICLETSDDAMVIVEVTKNKTSRVGSKYFNLRQLVGAKFGSVFEIRKSQIVQIYCDLGEYATVESSEEVTGGNKDYADTNTAQKISFDQIQEMKDQGASGRDIIDALVQGSDTWDSKTAFSKEKYLKKKFKKYVPRFRVLRPSPLLLCDIYFQRNPSKIGFMRSDSLGQVLSFSSVYSGCTAMIVDTFLGLVTATVAERLDGHGRILALYPGQQHSADLMRRMNFDEKQRGVLVPYPMNQISWVEKTEEEIDEAGLEKLDPEAEKRKEEWFANLPEERKAKAILRQQKRDTELTPKDKRDLIRGGCDSLIIASKFDPLSTVKVLLKYLKPSRSFVIYCEALEPLVETFHYLQQSEEVIALQLSGTWSRDYQVLPSRTHPQMTMSSESGYVLTGIKVLAAPASATRAVKQPADRSPSKDPTAKKPRLSESTD